MIKSIDQIIDLYKSGTQVGIKGPCDGFEGPCSEEGERYRQNTKYVNEDANYKVMCPKCREANDEYWADMWSDYWSGCL